MKKHYETHVEDTDKLISVAGPVLDYKSWYEQYRKLMEEQAQRKYGLYTPTSEGDDDDFPSITGMIARYSALGLTNEQMAANPVWVDKTGNGHDLQMKNFAWKEGSGISDIYPGFILGDGVDDFAVTEKELNFEDTYTVYTAFIPFQNNPTRNMILCGADSKKTFSMQYSSLVYVSFIAGNNYYINADFVNGLNLFACKRNGNNIYIKNLLTNKVVTGTCGDWVENAGLYYLWKNATYASFARAAIAGQTICNGYFSTDEDDEKVLDWYKKQYPWLFPDQAWTVTGKTNEDEDRATIANITGNGNNLVLSNFGFIEGSGYNKEGEYAGYLVTDGVDDKVQSSSFTMNEDWTIVGDWELLSNVQINCGIVKSQNVYLYNTAKGLLISINNPRSLQSFGTKSLHAICSDGRLYDRNWVEYEYTVDQNFEIVESSLNIGFNLNNYTQIAFKNLGIYNDQILSKDDCIKAYNYLQTLKAK